MNPNSSYTSFSSSHISSVKSYESSDVVPSGKVGKDVIYSGLSICGPHSIAFAPNTNARVDTTNLVNITQIISLK